jgi:F-type H+-transporting ATPase subunit epsilon
LSVPLQVDVVSVDRKLWTGEASAVFARTAEGDLGIMPGHTPLLAILGAGEVRVKPVSGSPVVAQVDGGFISVEHDRVTVVSDTASLVSGSSAT